MKIEFEKQDLIRGINIALRAVPAKSTMEILECIAINAAKTGIKFTTNDLELGIESYVKGSVLEEGNIAVNARFFSDIIRKLPDSTITLETENANNVTIKCNKVEVLVPYVSADDFPILPTINSQNDITLSQFTLKEMIKQTIFSISENDTRKIMTGELLESNQDNLKLASLDSYRLSIRNVSLKKESSPLKVIIPGKTLIEISKILSDNYEDTMCIQVTDKHILFSFNSTKIVSRLIEGEFYSVDKLITNDYVTKIDINKRALLECIDRATLLICENERKPIVLNIEEQSLKLNIKSNLGAINEVIDIAKEGPDIRIAFNPKYLLDALRVIDEEEITIYFNSNKTPCTIKDSNNTYIYLISPLSYQE